MPGNSRTLFIILFMVSGFAGLIYESIWTQYLKLFLGHAAYAQTLVLSVFMGGMALGSWISAQYSKRWGNLLLGYALVEAIIGVCAVLFHPLYIQFLDLAYTRLIPGLGSPSLITLFKWTAAGLFILPQSILLGMTFPLMTAGVIRRFPDSPGAAIALLYFTNSIGAAAGVLASGFLFIPWAGLPGTLVLAGVINIAVAAIIWLRVREDTSFEKLQLVSASPQVTSGFASRLLLVVAFLTGTSSFIYEIGWIRMLNQVLSSSTHAFELMLSAFVTGLALGGLWIRRRIDGLNYPVRFLAFVQVAMGVLALATLPLYGHTFEAMAWLIKHLPKTITGYALFNIISHSMALAIMLPATFCAGMTLPLVTAILLRDGQGEKSIGMVYAFNTIGCIIGVFVAVHFAMPVLGLKLTIGLGAGIDIALGLILAWWAIPSLRIRFAITAAGGAILLITLAGVTFDPHKLASGVYRLGVLLDQSEQEIVYYQDVKTATVSVTKDKQALSIRTNGKSDASIALPGHIATVDEDNMVLLGVLPLALNVHARTAANIGWGSGLTTNTLLSTRRLERVDTIEIEPAMIEAAKLFRPRVNLAYDDPRSHIHIEDAKTFFSLHGLKYDIIVSEPSNPWVSGVAGLFSEEFYRQMKDHLHEDGLLVQWLQMYEIDMPLAASVFKALSSQFADYVVYASNRADLIIIARPHGTVPEIDTTVLREEGLSGELKRVGIMGLQDVAVRRIGNKSILQPLFDSYPVPANSDYYSYLDLYAAQSRFLRTNSMNLILNDVSLLPAVPMLSHKQNDEKTGTVSFSHFERSTRIHVARMLLDYILHDRWVWDHPDAPLVDNVRQRADMVRRILSDCSGKSWAANDWGDGMYYGVTENILPYATPSQLNDLWRRFEAPSCWSKLPALPRSHISLLKAIGNRDAAKMSQSARVLLQEWAIAPSLLQKYILAAGLLGDLSNGQPKDALSLMRQYGSRLDERDYQSVLMRLFTGHIVNALQIPQVKN